LRKKEKEEKRDAPDTRLYSRSSIRFLSTIIEEVAVAFGLTRGRMSRCLSYHGASILQDDSIVRGLVTYYSEVRKLAVEKDNPDIAGILTGLIAYTPGAVDAVKTSFLVYDGRILSEIEDMAQVCGVFPGQVAQVAMLRSLLTCDSPVLSAVTERLVRESKRWDVWMSFRLSVLEVAVARWESLL